MVVAPFAWLASSPADAWRLGFSLHAQGSNHYFRPRRLEPGDAFGNQIELQFDPRGFAPRTPLHALLRQPPPTGSDADVNYGCRSVRVARVVAGGCLAARVFSPRARIEPLLSSPSARTR